MDDDHRNLTSFQYATTSIGWFRVQIRTWQESSSDLSGGLVCSVCLCDWMTYIVERLQPTTTAHAGAGVRKESGKFGHSLNFKAPHHWRSSHWRSSGGPATIFTADSSKPQCSHMQRQRWWAIRWWSKWAAEQLTAKFKRTNWVQVSNWTRNISDSFRFFPIHCRSFGPFTWLRRRCSVTIKHHNEDHYWQTLNSVCKRPRLFANLKIRLPSNSLW